MKKIKATILVSLALVVGIIGVSNAQVTLKGPITFKGLIKIGSTPAAAAAEFSPTDISGLKLWLDASDSSKLYTDSSCSTPVASDGDAVGCWQDKSGNSAHIIQATSGNKPTYKTGIQNGKSIVRTDATGTDYLQGSSFSLTTATASFFVAWNRTDDTPIGAALISFRDSSGGNDYDNNQSVLMYYANLGDYRNGVQCQQAGSSTGDYIWNSIYDGSFNHCYLDGSSDGTPVAQTNSFSAEVVTVGKRDQENFYATGDYFEIIVYDSALSDTDRQRVRDYLNTKWAIY